MNLVKWNPWREMPMLNNRLNRLFDDPFFRIGRMADDDSMGMWNPAVDLYEKNDHFVIKAELPGVDKNDIKVDLQDRVLTLSGERTDDKEVNEENFYRSDRSDSGFDLRKCKVCTKRYYDEHRHKVRQQSFTEAPLTPWEMECRKDQVRRALQPTGSVFEDAL